MAEKPDNKKSSNKRLIILCVGLVGLLAWVSSFEPPEYKPGKYIFDAGWACKEMITKQLKSPSTAEFSKGITREDVKHLGGDLYLVDSYVDSQNGYSAMLRTKFTCKLQGDASGKMKFVDWSID